MRSLIAAMKMIVEVVWCWQVVRNHRLGLSCMWEWPSMEGATSNGTSPAATPFTTWKFRPDGVSQRTIDFIW
jgi:hypothetical protein